MDVKYEFLQNCQYFMAWVKIFNKLDLEKDQGQSWHHIKSYH